MNALTSIDATFLAWLVPVVLAAVQVVKAAAPGLKPGWLPLVALLAAVSIAGVACLADPPTVETWTAGAGYWLLHALLGGLSASGLYSVAGKKVLNGLASLLFKK